MSREKIDVPEIIVFRPGNTTDAYIHGTQISVQEIASLYIHGARRSEILTAFPVLSNAKLMTVLEYLSKVNTHVKRRWAQELQRPGRAATEDVFTPRNPEVNEEMYVERAELEFMFLRALSGYLQIVLHGDSGCGKTWLYQKLLSDKAVPYVVVDCASVALLGSFKDAFSEIIDREGVVELVGYTEEKAAGLKVPFAEAGVKHVGEFRHRPRDSYERLLEFVAERSNGHQAIVVLDNLEQIVDSDKLMQELGAYITLSDNRHYAKYNTKLLIVGTPAGVKDYFARTKTQGTVANRLVELPEVKGLTKGETKLFCQKGFVEQLLFVFQVDDFTILTNVIFECTTGVPQRLHELCFHIANALEENQLEDLEVATQIAIVRWLQDSMAQFVSNLYTCLKDMSGENMARAQLIYAMAKFDRELFTATELEDKVCEIFASPFDSKRFGKVDDLLEELSTSEPKILEQTSNLRAWRFADARYKMCIRASLRPDDRSGRLALLQV